jgi:hypothetical protein
MIVVDTTDFVIGCGSNIERVFENDENLIKVIKSNGMFYYIADGENFEILNIDTPDDNKLWFYTNGEFIESIIPPLSR